MGLVVNVDYWKFWEVIETDREMSGTFKCILCDVILWNVSSNKIDFPLILHIDVFHNPEYWQRFIKVAKPIDL